MINLKKSIKSLKKNKKTIVYPEAQESERIALAGMYLNKKQIANVIFVGDESALVLKYGVKKLKGITIINPKTHDLLENFARMIYEKRKEKGVSEEEAKDLTMNPVYFATLLVKCDIADAMVCGATTTTAETVRPALQLMREKNERISACCFLYGKSDVFAGGKGSLLLSDPAININPTATELAEIAITSANTMRNVFKTEPKVALLSFSTKGSANGESPGKVKEAVQILRQKNVDFEFDGEFQLDSALCFDVRKRKAPESTLLGNANVLIFPNLDSANICYKAFERVAGLTNIGPILQGFEKPISDLSRGASTNDIIRQSIITLLQTKEIK